MGFQELRTTSALFFGVKDFCKKQFRTMGFSKEQSTILAVTAANIPFWVIRTPTETLKTKQQVGEASLVDTYKALYAEGGASAVATGLYGSYTSNFVYALPTDIIKFVSCKVSILFLLSIVSMRDKCSYLDRKYQMN